MSNRTLSIDDRIYDYLLAVSSKEPALLKQLREETAGIEFSEMQIAPEQGQFMALLVKLIGARRALEVGTFTGYSSICIAAALAPGGELVCCDDSAEWTAMAKRYWRQAGLEDRISFKLGDASTTLMRLIDDGKAGTFDFIFIDADKQNYTRYYELSLQLLRVGGLMAVDNTLWSGDVADPDNMEPGTRAIRRFNEMLKNDNSVDFSLVPIGDGLTLVRKPAPDKK
ncbi:MAG: SAM-dependent methyltransferase [Gammaproteobacteria bacterium]|nr:class I SAM-dependent methyltransferase [Gammaproteobacteria bacterium]NNL07498.1 SAM-dependent methyltransferase [Gammaproteobacteria bacterium]